MISRLKGTPRTPMAGHQFNKYDKYDNKYDKLYKTLLLRFWRLPSSLAHSPIFLKIDFLTTRHNSKMVYWVNDSVLCLKHLN